MLAAQSLLPSPTDYLSKGRVFGEEVTFVVGDMYSNGFLIAAGVLALAAIILVWVMFQRVRFYARDFGDGGFGGRLKAISGFLVIALFMCVGAVFLALIGLGNQGYSVVLSPRGVTESGPAGSYSYTWNDLNRHKSSDHFKTTDFTLVFEQGKDESLRSCRLRIWQQTFGENVQDAAIAITEQAVRGLPPLSIE